MHQYNLSVAVFIVCSRRIKDILSIQQRNTGTYQNYRREICLRPDIADKTIYNRPVSDRTEKSRKTKEGCLPNQESQIRINEYIYGNINNTVKDLRIGVGDTAVWRHPYTVLAVARSDNRGYNRMLGIIMSVQIIYWNVIYSRDNAELVL